MKRESEKESVILVSSPQVTELLKKLIKKGGRCYPAACSFHSPIIRGSDLFEPSNVLLINSLASFQVLKISR